jgi:GPH family glycoside/pentoside/hexuronide:cation symporter
VYFLVGSILFYLGYTIFATPWVALGYELTPDYHERTRLMGVQNFIGQIAYMVSPWFLWFMTQEKWFADQVEGASTLAILVAIVTVTLGILPAIFLRERFADTTEKPEGPKPLRALGQNLVQFFKGFAITLRSKPFLKLCVATFLVFNGFILISAFQSYVIIYYVTGGDQALGAEYAGYSGTASAIAIFVVIAIVTWLGTRIGKRQAFFVSTGISILGYALKWPCYDPDMPMLVVLPAPLMAFGLGGLFTLMPAMVADVVDFDELETHERREGMFGFIFWWVVKLGMAAAIAGGGYLLDATGFDVDAGENQTESTLFWMRVFDVVISIFTSALVIWAVAIFKITEEKANEVRNALAERRGAR